MRRTLLVLVSIAVAGTLWGALADPGNTNADASRTSPTAATPPSRSAPRRRHVNVPRGRTADATSATAEIVEFTVPDDGPWTVRLLGPGDVPLEGILVAVDERQFLHNETNADGVAVLPGVTDEETVKIEINGYVPVDWVVLEKRYTVIRYPDLVPLEVRIVDGLDGRPLEAASVTLPGELDQRRRLPRVGDAFVAFPSRFSRGRYSHGNLYVAAPPGYAVGDSHVSDSVAPHVDRVRVDLPTWPLGSVYVRVMDAAGVPVPGAIVKWPQVTGFGQSRPPRTTGVDGRVVFPGVRIVPGELVEVDAATDDRFAIVRSAPLCAEQRVVELEVALPAERCERPARPRRCGGSSAGFRRTYAAPQGGTLPLRVRVLCGDGRPARGVGVRVYGEVPDTWRDWGQDQIAGDDGHVTFRGLPTGEATVVAWADGFMPISRRITLDDGTGELTLREPAGERLTVRVLDDRGAPVCSAQVEAECRSEELGVDWDHARVDGGTQTLQPCTDAVGEYVIDRLPADCRVDVEVRFGSRYAEVSAAPGTEVVVVRLPPASNE